MQPLKLTVRSTRLQTPRASRSHKEFVEHTDTQAVHLQRSLHEQSGGICTFHNFPGDSNASTKLRKPFKIKANYEVGSTGDCSTKKLGTWATSNSQPSHTYSRTSFA